jgi:hypothetical protein
MTTTTKNEAHGFYGTIRPHFSPMSAWPVALHVIANTTMADDEAARAFLDSKWGRHFADDVASGLAIGLTIDAAILAAVERWQGRKIGRRLSKQTGIPAGLPYLAALVQHEGIQAEAREE